MTDDHGRFIDALGKDDFLVFENGVRQEISHFSAGKVPVSLGIALDIWAEALTIGQPLPVLPLALRGAFVVPVNFQATYMETRQHSRL